MTAWQILAGAHDAHYWYFLLIAFAWSIAWCFRSRNQLIQIIGGTLAFLMAIGIARDFRCAPYPDTRFAEYVSILQVAPKGTEVAIPQYPGWQMKLIKR
jgi:hypothetical protein